ncbi:MAG: SRPBCC family protein [Gemmatimonadales bacterium]
MASSRTAVVTLPSDTQIQVTREFAAPKHLVYKAWTTPELIRRWWSAKRGEVTVAEVDLKPGGRWRYAMTTKKGFEVAFHGEYREIVPNERLVYTEVYEGAPDAPAVTTVSFAERDGRTTVTILGDHASKAARDAVIASGMENGLQDALDLLEEAAVALASR